MKTDPPKIRVFHADERPLDALVWCAVNHEANLHWIDGQVVCYEMCAEGFDVDEDILYVSQVCKAPCPEYVKIVEGGNGTRVAVIDVSEMGLFKKLLEVFDKDGAPE